MQRSSLAKYKRFVLVLLFASFRYYGSFAQDTLPVTRVTQYPKKITFLFNCGYRLPLNNNKILNSGHGLYIEGGLNAGRLLAKDLVLGFFGGFAMQDRFWYTSMGADLANDYGNAINKDQHFSALDSAIIYSSADLFKSAKGNAGIIPGCATGSFHNYSLYCGLIFRLPCKYAPILKVYKGTTRSHYQGDGNIATKQRQYNIFELSRAMYGCELGFFNYPFGSSQKITKNTIGISVYCERSNFYNSTLDFNDGVSSRSIALQSFTSGSFLTRYKTEVCWGIKINFYLL